MPPLLQILFCFQSSSFLHQHHTDIQLHHRVLFQLQSQVVSFQICLPDFHQLEQQASVQSPPHDPHMLPGKMGCHQKNTIWCGLNLLVCLHAESVIPNRNKKQCTHPQHNAMKPSNLQQTQQHFKTHTTQQCTQH